MIYELAAGVIFLVVLAKVVCKVIEWTIRRK